ncbi:MAG: VWA domain-containing protein, partial [Dehalococcoidales bacterium]|nr:VWA domain-containing protein [Dehalococcoidales bacterium]
LSPSVDFGTVRTLKRNLLIDFVTVLARLLTRHGNRLGAIFYSGKVEGIVPAQGGKAQVLRLINDLLAQPKAEHTPMTDLTPLLETALNVIRRRSLVFVISDFFSAPGWDRPLGMLARRNEVLAVRLYDPHEIDLPDIGPVIMEDAETGEQLYINTHDKSFRKRFGEAARKREHELDVTFGRAGVEVLPLSTEGDMVKDIVRFARLRKQRKLSPASFAKSNPSRPPFADSLIRGVEHAVSVA